MTTDLLSYWIKATINLTAKADGSTLTFLVTNRPAWSLTSTGTSYQWPILKEVQGIASLMGNYLPQTIGGSLILNNEPGSFGYERRFSDLLERYTIIDKEIKIELAEAPLSEGGATASYTQIWKGTARTISLDPKQKTISINIEPRSASTKVLTKLVDPANFLSAPQRSYGTSLPLIFGDTASEIRPVQISADSDSFDFIDYAYCTCLANTHLASAGTVYAKTQGDGYQAMTDAGTTTTVVQSQLTAASGTDSITSYLGNTIKLEYLSPITSGAYIINSIELEASGTGSGAFAYDGVLTFQIFEALSTDTAAGPGKLIFTASRTVSDYYTQWRAAGTFWVQFDFPEPLPLYSSKGFFFGVGLTGVQDTTGVPGAPMSNVYTGSNYQTWFGMNNSWQKGANTNFHRRWRMYGVTIDQNIAITTDEMGLSYNYVTLAQDPLVTAAPDLRKLDLIITATGLADDTGGTISGSPESTLVRPDHIIRMLSREYVKPDWVDTYFDSTKYATNNNAIFSATTNQNYRELSGITRGRRTYIEIASDLCRNSNARLVSINSNTASKYLGLYNWGANITSVATITDEDGELLDTNFAGIDTIINQISMLYQPGIKDTNLFQQNSEGVLQPYNGSLYWDYATNYISAALSSLSRTIFGDRYLANQYFDFIGDSTSAESMAKYLLAVFAFPHVYATIRCPLAKYKSIDMFDVVTITHPELSAYLGTSSNAKLPTYSGKSVDIMQGDYMKRAQPYRAQIEGRTLEFADNKIPLVTFNCRLLLNPNDPT